MDCTDAFDNSACKLKLVDNTHNCYGTVRVPCNNVLQFFYDANGHYDYSVVSGGLSDDGGGSSSAQVEGGNEGTSRGLRGAKRSNRLLL
jgi:hypothetical protein